MDINSNILEVCMAICPGKILTKINKTLTKHYRRWTALMPQTAWQRWIPKDSKMKIPPREVSSMRGWSQPIVTLMRKTIAMRTLRRLGGNFDWIVIIYSSWKGHNVSPLLQEFVLSQGSGASAAKFNPEAGDRWRCLRQSPTTEGARQCLQVGDQEDIDDCDMVNADGLWII